MSEYKPEGSLMDTPENRAALKSLSALTEAMQTKKILEARAVVCDSEHNLHVALNGGVKGIIPRVEGAIGIADGSTRDIAIISRVNKPVCFRVMGIERGENGETVATLSRRVVQEQCMEEYISQLRPGDVIDGRITHLETFGSFVDIGCGICSLIPIDVISVSRISHPEDRFRTGQYIRAVVQATDGKRVTLSHRELLGTWEENAALFQNGETVAGIVRSVEEYGIFVELTPNLAGLAEPREGVMPGQQASVYIKSLIPERMKVKLIMVDAFDADYQQPSLRYFFQGDHMDRWVYSPSVSHRKIETVFTQKENEPLSSLEDED
jgi:small subunit ribosomal protein S1